jgi:hypothetical protein
MNYSVQWTERALDELAAVWTAASDRNGVTTASHRRGGPELLVS